MRHCHIRPHHSNHRNIFQPNWFGSHPMYKSYHHEDMDVVLPMRKHHSKSMMGMVEVAKNCPVPGSICSLFPRSFFVQTNNMCEPTYPRVDSHTTLSCHKQPRAKLHLWLGQFPQNEPLLLVVYHIFTVGNEL